MKWKRQWFLIYHKIDGKFLWESGAGCGIWIRIRFKKNQEFGFWEVKSGSGQYQTESKTLYLLYYEYITTSLFKIIFIISIFVFPSTYLNVVLTYKTKYFSQLSIFHDLIFRMSWFPFVLCKAQTWRYTWFFSRDIYKKINGLQNFVHKLGDSATM